MPHTCCSRRLPQLGQWQHQLPENPRVPLSLTALVRPVRDPSWSCFESDRRLHAPAQAPASHLEACRGLSPTPPTSGSLLVPHPHFSSHSGQRDPEGPEKVTPQLKPSAGSQLMQGRAPSLCQALLTWPVTLTVLRGDLRNKDTERLSSYPKVTQ